jgi:acyl-CoA hydrolase
MKGTNRIKLLSVFLIAAYLLSACSGAAPQSGSPVSGGKSQAKEVAFTGTVESVSSGEITVSGQVVAIDAKTVLDPNIKVGDIVKVEAQVSDTGAVTALKIESSGADDTTTDPGNANDTNTNADATNTNDSTTTGNDNINSNSNDNSNGAVGVEQEIVGVVEAISADSVTVGGVTYSFASFTEFKTPILVGDSVKLHLIVNADGTLTVREIEKTGGASIGDDNSNGNGNSNDNNGNDDNGNDDEGDDNSNSNSSDDNGNDDNSNGGSNSNGNSNGG